MTNTVVEHWLPIRGFEGFYEVSSLGRVSSVDRAIPLRNGRLLTAKGRVLVLSVDSDGRLSAGLSVGGKQHRFKVDALVLEAFVEPRPTGYYVRHLDGDQGNCQLSNLRWSPVPRLPRARVAAGRTAS